MEYRKEPAFINRQQEINYLKGWIEQRPEQILFFYGPKSSGKTTLLYKFAKQLIDENKFSLKLFNLREVLIVNYEDFLERFFQVEQPEERDASQTRQYNLKFFKLTVNTQKRLKERQIDPFDVMKMEMHELNAKGIKPIIIIDELQALDFIYFNSQRELIKEIINFFVAMTKESHLCHILLSSSDGYFIERLYNDSKLKKTSKLYEIDYLPYEDIVYWLNNLKKESKISDYVLTQDQIEYIWDHFGGSIWEISAMLGDLLLVAEKGKIADQKLQEIVYNYLLQAKSYFLEYASIDEAKIALLKKISELVSRDGFFQEPKLADLVKQGYFNGQQGLREELNFLVRQNYLYYNPTRAEYKLQGRSMEIGLAWYAQEM